VVKQKLFLEQRRKGKEGRKGKYCGPLEETVRIGTHSGESRKKSKLLADRKEKEEKIKKKQKTAVVSFAML